jgi:uncharacterized membrane protein
MRKSGSIAAFSLSLLAAACSAPEDGSNAEANSAGTNGTASANASAPAPAAGWDLQSSGEGAALVLAAAPDAPPAIRLFCPSRQGRLLVNVPGFRPVGSEERLSFGGGGDAAALVADPAGDRQRGGVSGIGPVPAQLAAFLAGPVSASYGAQASGPHPVIPADLARGFVAACSEGAAAAPAPAPAPGGPAPGGPAAGGQAEVREPMLGGPCTMQGSVPVRAAPIRAVGTEPFWNARTQGRCVTYSHPDDQSGTRVWTRYTPGAGGGGTWEGALGKRRFALTVRPAPGCSDGMSDRRYPFAAELVVNGERRRGCAAPG